MPIDDGSKVFEEDGPTGWIQHSIVNACYQLGDMSSE
jgi:hypothetical protein